MTMVDIPGSPLEWPLGGASDWNSSNTTWFTIANGQKIAWIVQIPKSGSLTRISFIVASITANGSGTVTIETVDATTGNPTGTLAYANATGTVTITSSSAPIRCSINSPSGVTCTAGDTVAVVFTSTGFAGSVMQGSVAVSWAHSFPYLNLYTTSWTKAGTTSRLTMVIDGVYVNPYKNALIPTQANANPHWSSTSNPDRRGVKFAMPFTARLVSAVITFIVYAPGGNFNVILYDHDGVTPLETITRNYLVCGRNGAPFAVQFSTKPVLEQDKTYRLVLLPLASTADSASMAVSSVSLDGTLDPMFATISGNAWQYTYCNGAPTDMGSWTDDSNPTFMGIRFYFDQVDDGLGVA